MIPHKVFNMGRSNGSVWIGLLILVLFSPKSLNAQPLCPGSPTWSETITCPLSWSHGIKLEFSDYNLGNHSYLYIISKEDAADQYHDSRSLPQWFDRSAIFNGNSVDVCLYVDPADAGLGISAGTIAEDCVATIGEYGPRGNGLCDSDDRVASTDAAVGRLLMRLSNDCTGWIASNGALLTAGACWGEAGVLFELNVPPSDEYGKRNFSDPDDQYPMSGFVFIQDGSGQYGNDWAVFKCNPNSNTGLLPAQAQQAFYRISRDITPAHVEVIGYGRDTTDPEDNYAQQTDSGPFIGETLDAEDDVWIEYMVDTQSSNSGSPVIDMATPGTAVGIHTDGGCDPSGGTGNKGTSFENDALENAIQTFHGENTTYVDRGFFSHALEDGTVFRPFDEVGEAAAAMISGGIISIVRGEYNEVLTLGADGKAMTLIAPVGGVSIDPL